MNNTSVAIVIGLVIFCAIMALGLLVWAAIIALLVWLFEAAFNINVDLNIWYTAAFCMLSTMMLRFIFGK